MVPNVTPASTVDALVSYLGAATDDVQRALEAGRVAGRGQWRAALRRRGWRPKRAADGGVRARVHRRLGEFDLQRAAVRGGAAPGWCCGTSAGTAAPAGAILGTPPSSRPAATSVAYLGRGVPDPCR